MKNVVAGRADLATSLSCRVASRLQMAVAGLARLRMLTPQVHGWKPPRVRSAGDHEEAGPGS